MITNESLLYFRKRILINELYGDSESMDYEITPHNYQVFKRSNNIYTSGLSSYKRRVTQSSPFVPAGRGMSFSIDDYLSSGKEKYTTDTIDPHHLDNAQGLLKKVNKLGELIAYNGIITSGYRSPERQRQIYAEKGESPAMGSKHLSGHAMDISDPYGQLKEKILNVEVLERARDLGLYFENFDQTPTWVHIQDEAPVRTGGQIWSADNLLQRI